MTVRPARRTPMARGDEGRAGRSRRLARRALGRDWRVAYLFVAPLLALLFGLIGYPLAKALRLSLYATIGRASPRFVGLENYILVWQNPSYRDMLAITAKFVGFSLAGQATLGMVAALLLHHTAPRWRGLWTGLLLLPWVVPDVVAAMTWRGLYDPINGVLNRLLGGLGIWPAYFVWLDRATALPAVSVVNIWKGFPFFTILLLAGLQAIDPALYDAAAVDGAGGWERFRHVTLPGLRHVLGVASLLTILFSLNAYTLVALLTSGGPLGATRIFPLYVTAAAAGRGQGGQIASSLSLAPFLLLLIALLGRALRGERALVPAPRGPVARVLAVVSRPCAFVARLPLLALDAIVDGAGRVVEAVAPRRPAPPREYDALRAWRAYQWRQRRGTAGRGLGLGLLLIFALAPFYWITVTAFKSNQQITTWRSPFWPDPWTTFQFSYVLEKTDFRRWYGNTLQVALVSCVVSVLVGALGAYAIARLRFRGGDLLAAVILATALVPSVLYLVPLFLLLAQLHLYNTPGALLVSYPSFGLPMACWLLLGYFRALPEELEEAALIDGCSHWQAFLRIVLPLSRPALLAVALFTLTQAWNELIFAGFFIRSEAYWTLPRGLSGMVTGDIFPYGRMFAASLLMALPISVAAAIGQRAMVSGLTAGAVKG